MSVIRISSTRSAAARYLSCLRLDEILVLQGSPALGAAFGIHQPTKYLGLFVILTIANVCLVAHIFLLNDWAGLSSDLSDPHKAASVFTARGVDRKEIGVLAAGMLVVSLALMSTLGASTLGLSVAIATLSALYSIPRLNWKGRPLLSSAAHLAGGALHFLLGYSVGSVIDSRGFVIAIFFGLTFAAGHLTQEVRDHAGDAVNATRTNAVTFGQRRTFAASVALFLMAYVLLVVLALRGTVARPLAALVVLFPIHLLWSLEALTEGLTYESVCRLQTRYRVLYTLIGLAMLAALWAAQPMAAGWPV